MSVWLCVPSARPVAEVEPWCEKWHAMGYKIALWRDADMINSADYSIMGMGDYPGWPVASNRLIDAVLTADPECHWVVCGGDDTLPDPNKRADEIAAECSAHFAQVMWRLQHAQMVDGKLPLPFHPGTSTFGVMQPTGDRWGEDDYSRRTWPDAPAQIDRIAGSPWIGREFCVRINQGRGPLWPEYRHNWSDEELQNVALKLGAFWQRRDLTHYHDHARRNGGQWQSHQKWFDADYSRMKPLFDRRKAAGWPGSEPL